MTSAPSATPHTRCRAPPRQGGGGPARRGQSRQAARAPAGRRSSTREPAHARHHLSASPGSSCTRHSRSALRPRAPSGRPCRNQGCAMICAGGARQGSGNGDAVWARGCAGVARGAGGGPPTRGTGRGGARKPSAAAAAGPGWQRPRARACAVVGRCSGSRASSWSSSCSAPGSTAAPSGGGRRRSSSSPNRSGRDGS